MQNALLRSAGVYDKGVKDISKFIELYKKSDKEKRAFLALDVVDFARLFDLPRYKAQRICSKMPSFKEWAAESHHRYSISVGDIVDWYESGQHGK